MTQVMLYFPEICRLSVCKLRIVANVILFSKNSLTTLSEWYCYKGCKISPEIICSTGASPLSILRQHSVLSFFAFSAHHYQSFSSFFLPCEIYVFYIFFSTSFSLSTSLFIQPCLEHSIKVILTATVLFFFIILQNEECRARIPGVKYNVPLFLR